MTSEVDTASLTWQMQCGRRIKEIEPRLALADCAELAATLWQLDDYQGMPPHAAAERFMANNPCADVRDVSPWWHASS